MPPTRRSFLKGGLGALGASVFPGCERETSPVGTRSLSLGGDVPWGGAIVGAPADAGHLVRQSRFPSPTQHRRTRVAIVGGGISALSAAWWLNRHSFKDFLLFELDVVPGGNARSGHNQHGNHPWGAHYVPIPNQEATYVQELLYDVGVITDFDEEGKPNYDDLYVCHAPEERLYIHGVWQDGLVPVIGISKEDERQYRAFFSLIDELRYRRGGDGKPAFAVPIHFSSADTEFTALDKCSFHQYLNERSFTSTPLRWYLDYCCRDDFGASSRDVSAWAGLHYFAGRRPLSSIPLDSNLLTWPEGNGWIERQRWNSATLIERSSVRWR